MFARDCFTTLTRFSEDDWSAASGWGGVLVPIEGMNILNGRMILRRLESVAGTFTGDAVCGVGVCGSMTADNGCRALSVVRRWAGLALLPFEESL